MALYAIQNNQKDYELFEEFKTTFIINKCSLFDKSLNVFNQKNLDEFEERFIKNYIAGNNQKFNEKAFQQLKNSSFEFKHFFTNYLWLYNLFFSSLDDGHYHVSKSVASKKSELELYLEQSISDHLIPKYGFANCGTSYNTRKDVEICYIHIFMKKIFDNPNILNEENALIQFIKTMSVQKQLIHYIGANVFKAGIKNILLFLLIPEKFDPIVSYTDKENILKGFGKIDVNRDIDDNLLLIRQKFNIQNSFYDDENLQKWQNIKRQSTPKKSYEIKIINPDFLNLNSTLNQNFVLKTNEDLKEEYNNKLIAGKKAEEIVYLDLVTNFMSNPKKLGSYFKIISQELTNLYTLEKIQPLMNKSLKEICMFSTYIHTTAPFDIVYTNGSSVKFVEVKSCSSKPYKIFMSFNELKFAFENIDHYELKIVIDEKIYSLDNFPIEDLYYEINNINVNSLFSINNFEFLIDIK